MSVNVQLHRCAPLLVASGLGGRPPAASEILVSLRLCRDRRHRDDAVVDGHGSESAGRRKVYDLRSEPQGSTHHSSYWLLRPPVSSTGHCPLKQSPHASAHPIPGKGAEYHSSSIDTGYGSEGANRSGC